MNNSLTNKKYSDNFTTNVEENFDDIYLKYYQDLCAFACNYTNDTQKAEDIVQDVLLKFWESKNYINFKGNIKSYLMTSVYHAFLDLIRKENTLNKNLEELRYKLLRDIIEEDNDILNKKISLLKEEIDELPLRCKEIFMLCKFKNLKYSQIAEKLNISKNTVENQIGKAYKILRKNLKDKDVFNLFLSFLNKRKVSLP
ncbi:RNA polymerase sigma-70 factor [Aestuariibaculum sediminum]|uniref:RNA polymerase sigma-70 factor n=1 Tax=Aestuariibaculum sediminum TaxID=2770637 RepID=A0A8J6QAF1_9FLAO|nr:RNA polymerase sigma-70 factor [Aestuariibaculum sediminum]MBD0833382.1 RNA polymerase sigma-70 factor [Aestuariibaculum sediminum]